MFYFTSRFRSANSNTLVLPYLSSNHHPLGNSNLISLRSDLAISCGFRKDRLRLVVFLVRMWLLHDFR